jgi:hypothetical protein
VNLVAHFELPEPEEDVRARTRVDVRGDGRRSGVPRSRPLGVPAGETEVGHLHGAVRFEAEFHEIGIDADGGDADPLRLTVRIDGDRRFRCGLRLGLRFLGDHRLRLGRRRRDRLGVVPAPGEQRAAHGDRRDPQGAAATAGTVGAAQLSAPGWWNGGP